MNVSEYIFDYYSKKGIDTVFMVSGGQAMWLDDAVGKNKNYTVICTHHEQSAAMSSDAYGRIKNKPSITLITAGPGCMNAINGVAGAYTDSSPMIVISGQSNLNCVEYQNNTGIRQYGVQGINIKPIVQSIVKHFVTVDDPQKIEYYLEKAYREALSGRPGPVWIEVPLNIQSKEINEKFLSKYDENNINQDSMVSPKQAAKQFYKKLSESKRPLILVGQGISLSGSREKFLDFVHYFNIPVVTARLGIDLINSDDDLYVGRPGNYGERSANFAIQNSDFIISIGCRLASSLVGHNPQEFGKNAYLFVIDIDKKELDKPGPIVDYKADINCYDFFKEVENNRENYEKRNYSSWVKKCNEWKKKYPVVQKKYRKCNPINSYYFVDRLSKITSKDASILIDTGSCFHVACQTWKIKKGQNYLTTGGLSSMGYWAAGIGACIANNRKNTIVLTGDGSLQMNIQEFATIKYNKLPIKLFILNNNGYLLIRHTQKNFMNSRFVGEGPDSGVWCPDVAKIAKAYGIKSLKIDSPEEIDYKIKEALEYDGPVICDVVCDPWQLLIPRISSEKMPDGTLKSRKYEDMFPYLSESELKDNMKISERKK